MSVAASHAGLAQQLGHFLGQPILSHVIAAVDDFDGVHYLKDRVLSQLFSRECIGASHLTE